MKNQISILQLNNLHILKVNKNLTYNKQKTILAQIKTLYSLKDIFFLRNRDIKNEFK